MLHQKRPSRLPRLLSAIIQSLPTDPPAPRPALWSKAGLRRYLPGAIALTIALVVTFVVHWRGFAGWPGLLNSDEGIYASQAWAVQFEHRPSPFTYQYDHPFFGWSAIAAYTWVTNAFHRSATSLIAAREAMLVVHMVSSVFLYLLSRRLKLRPVAAAAAILLFSLSPLALQFQRMVFLDNLAVMWTIITLWALASPRRSLRSATIAGLAFAMAVLSKETILMLLPGVALMYWDHRDARNAKMRGAQFWWIFALAVFVYPLYAVVKSELFPGRGHVSLLGSILWQLHGRAGSGSILDSSSGTYETVSQWLHTDPFLLGGGAVLAVVALAMKRLRAVAVCFLVQVVMLCRNGYLPYPYVTAIFPFAAIVCAGVGDRVWTAWKARQQAEPDTHRWLRPAFNYSTRLALTALCAYLAIVVLPHQWGPTLTTAMTATPNTAIQEATTYVAAHVPSDAVLVTDDLAWTDLKMKGRNAIPTFKLDLDPAIRAQLTDGYRSVGYLLLTQITPADLDAQGLPLVAEALRHSKMVKSFGNGTLILRKVQLN